jgi:flagellar hook-associated protein 3 FlgL
MVSTIHALSTLHANIAGRRTVERARSEVELVSKELATGFKADVAKDLGMRSSQSIAMRNAMSKTDNFLISSKLMDTKMEQMADVMMQFRDTAQGFLNLVVGNKESPTPSVATLQAEAKSVMGQLVNFMNTSVNGQYLFSGLDTDRLTMNGYEEVNGGTGMSMAGVVNGIVAGGPTSAADAASKIADLDMVFTSNDTVTPNRNFEATFFNGTPLLNGGGTPNDRVEAYVAENTNVSYGIQANDPDFLEIFKGVAMIASTDPAQIGDIGAYRAWMSESVGSLVSGIKGMTETEARLGKQREFLEDTTISLENKRDIYHNKILDLERADPYEAAAKLSALQTQLEATYSTTARISKLSFLNYM